MWCFYWRRTLQYTVFRENKKMEWFAHWSWSGVVRWSEIQKQKSIYCKCLFESGAPSGVGKFGMSWARQKKQTDLGEDSDQAGHPPSLMSFCCAALWVVKWFYKDPNVLQVEWRLIRLGWSESSQGAWVILLILIYKFLRHVDAMNDFKVFHFAAVSASCNK